MPLGNEIREANNEVKPEKSKKKERKWSLGGLFRRKKPKEPEEVESDSDSSDSGGKKRGGFLARRRRRKASERGTEDVTASFEHVIVRPSVKSSVKARVEAGRGMLGSSSEEEESGSPAVRARRSKARTTLREPLRVMELESSPRTQRWTEVAYCESSDYDARYATPSPGRSPITRPRNASASRPPRPKPLACRKSASFDILPVGTRNIPPPPPPRDPHRKILPPAGFRCDRPLSYAFESSRPPLGDSNVPLYVPDNESESRTAFQYYTDKQPRSRRPIRIAQRDQPYHSDSQIAGTLDGKLSAESSDSKEGPLSVVSEHQELRLKRKSGNLEDALNELEAIYKSLQTKEEEDEGQRRSHRGFESDSGFTYTDDMAYRRLNRNDSRAGDNSRILSQVGSYLLVSPTLSPPPFTTVPPVPPPPNDEPDITLDDVVYRTMRHTNNRLRVADPQPPFGIPLGPVSPAPSSDYLHAAPRHQYRPTFKPRKTPDIVKDDLAFRNLRKDNQNDSLLSVGDVFVSPHHDVVKKKRAVRSLSANLLNIIQKEQLGFGDTNNNRSYSYDRASSYTDLPDVVNFRYQDQDDVTPRASVVYPFTSTTSTETLTDSRADYLNESRFYHHKPLPKTDFAKIPSPHNSASSRKFLQPVDGEISFPYSTTYPCQERNNLADKYLATRGDTPQKYMIKSPPSSPLPPLYTLLCDNEEPILTNNNNNYLPYTQVEDNNNTTVDNVTEKQQDESEPPKIRNTKMNRKKSGEGTETVERKRKEKLLVKTKSRHNDSHETSHRKIDAAKSLENRTTKTPRPRKSRSEESKMTPPRTLNVSEEVVTKSPKSSPRKLPTDKPSPRIRKSVTLPTIVQPVEITNENQPQEFKEIQSPRYSPRSSPSQKRKSQLPESRTDLDQLLKEIKGPSKSLEESSLRLEVSVRSPRCSPRSSPSLKRKSQKPDSRTDLDKLLDEIREPAKSVQESSSSRLEVSLRSPMYSPRSSPSQKRKSQNPGSRTDLDKLLNEIKGPLKSLEEPSSRLDVSVLSPRYSPRSSPSQKRRSQNPESRTDLDKLLNEMKEPTKCFEESSSSRLEVSLRSPMYSPRSSPSQKRKSQLPESRINLDQLLNNTKELTNNLDKSSSSSSRLDVSVLSPRYSPRSSPSQKRKSQNPESRTGDLDRLLNEMKEPTKSLEESTPSRLEVSVLSPRYSPRSSPSQKRKSQNPDSRSDDLDRLLTEINLKQGEILRQEKRGSPFGRITPVKQEAFDLPDDVFLDEEEGKRMEKEGGTGESITDLLTELTGCLDRDFGTATTPDGTSKGEEVAEKKECERVSCEVSVAPSTSTERTPRRDSPEESDTEFVEAIRKTASELTALSRTRGEGGNETAADARPDEGTAGGAKFISHPLVMHPSGILFISTYCMARIHQMVDLDLITIVAILIAIVSLILILIL